MLVEKVFDEVIYPDFKTFIEDDELYFPKVTKVYPQDSKLFPIIPIRLLPVTNRYNNLNYGEETYTFGIEIDVFSTDKIIENNKVSKKSICDELANKIVEYIKENYHFTIKVTHDAPNVDSNVHRNVITLTGVLDTKYGENNLVIYPRLNR